MAPDPAPADTLLDADLILVGGGLANGLIAWHLHQVRPLCRVLLLEAGPTLGGNHTWSFHPTDLTPAQRAIVAPLVAHQWGSHRAIFPHRRRHLAGGYASITSDRFDAGLRGALGARARVNTPVAKLEATRVTLADGTVLRAGAVIDARGPRPSPRMTLGYQKFLGQEVRLAAPHGLDAPVLMDASVAQLGGYRFVYLLPFTADTLLIEDTVYADGEGFDVESMRQRITAYAEQHGWSIRSVLREETGVLPIVLGGDIDGFWRDAEAAGRVPVAGLAAGLFHPTTGYSLPDAVVLAERLALLPDLAAPVLFDAIRAHAIERWHARSFFRFVNRLLFRAARPAERWKVMQRFYGLSEPLITRFYAGRLGWFDRMRILTGKPPVPIGAALRVVFAGAPMPASANVGDGAVTAAPRAVVIGAGFGGLALAVRLQAAGVPTTLVESRDKPGGRAYVYEDQGYVFDAGPTVITDPSALEELFAAGKRRMQDYVELLPVAPFYRLAWEDGTFFDYANDQAELDRQIRALEPADVEGYQRFLAYSKAVFAEGYLRLGTVPFLSFRSMIAAGPQLVKLEAWKSVHGIVARFIQNDHLRQAFSFHSLLVGGNPFATSSIYALIHALEREWGVWYPRGGTGALVRGLVKLFEDLGGTVRLNAPVERIELEAGRVIGVRLAGGERLPADRVASNADVVHTYDRLLGHEPVGAARAKRLKNKRFSMSLVVIHFGLKRRHEHLRHHMVCFGARYRELIEQIFKGPLADDFSLYLHSPCATDPSMAPPGCGSHYVLAPVPHLGNAPVDWAVEGPRLRDRILDYLEARYIPNLRADLVTCRLFTPADFRDELGAHLGSAFSLEPVLTQSAWFRPHNRDPKIPNLYITGAGTHPGAGVPGVVGSAKATAGLMLEDLV